MTLAELKTQLENACSNQGVLTLGAAALGSPALKSLFERYVPGGTLTLQVKDRQLDGDPLVFTGTAGWPWAPEAFKTEARFTVDGSSKVQVYLSVAAEGAAASWSLAKSFPELAKTPLADVTVESGQFILTSTEHWPGEQQDLTVGLNVLGTLKTGDWIEPLAQLISLDDLLKFQGHVLPDAGGAQIALDIVQDFKTNKSIGLEQIRLQLVAGRMGGQYSGHVRVVGVFEIGGHPQTITATLPSDAGVLLFDAELSGVSIDSLDALEGFLGKGGSSFDGKLPSPDFHKGGAILKLESASLGVTVPALEIQVISATISSSYVWRLFDGIIVVDSARLVLAITNAGVVATVQAHVDVTGVPVVVETTAEKDFVAHLKPGHAIHLPQLVHKFAPAIDGVPDLSVNVLEIRAGFGDGSYGAYDIHGALAGPWVLPLGANPDAFKLGPVRARLQRPSKDAKTTATIEAWASFLDTQLHLKAALGGPLLLEADFPKLALGSVIGELTPSSIPLPEIVRKLELDDARIKITESGSDMRLAVSATVENFGQIEIDLRRQADKWGVAAGFQLDPDWKFSNLGAALKILDDLNIANAAVVVASFDDPSYQFDQLTLRAPWDPGVIDGIKLTSALTVENSHVGKVPIANVGKFLGIEIDSLDLTAELAADLSQFSLAAGIDGDVPIPKTPITFTGVEVELAYRSEEVRIALKGRFDVSTPSDVLHFTVAAALDEVSVYASATMVGNWPDAMGITGLNLSDVALMLGFNFVEELPMLGITGQAEIAGFDGSLGLLFDTSGPVPAVLLAGSFSDISLPDIVASFCNAGVKVPASLAEVLDVELCGIPLFTLPGNLRSELNASVNQPKVSSAVTSAFTGKGTALGTEVLLVRGDSATGGGTKWFLTDRQAVKTYQIEDTGAELAVSSETQLYLSSGAVSIGELKMPGPAFRLGGRLVVHDFAFDLDVQGDLSQGIKIDADTEKPLNWSGVLKVSDAGGNGGPHVSLSTYKTGAVGPHFCLSGRVELMGLADAQATVDITVTSDGFSAHISGTLPTIAGASADVSFSSPTDFHADGAFSVGLGGGTTRPITSKQGHVLIPSIELDEELAANFNLTSDKSGLSLAFGGTFVWNKTKLSLPEQTATVTARDVQHFEQLGERVVAAVFDHADLVLHALYADAATWVANVNRYFKGEITNAADILHNDFRTTKEQTARLLQQLGTPANQIYRDLVSLGYSETAAIQALSKGIGMSATAIGKVLAGIGRDPVQVAEALHSALNLGWTELYDVLKNVFGLGWRAIVKILRDIF